MFAFGPLHDLREACSGHELLCTVLVHEIGEKVGLLQPGCDTFQDTLETLQPMCSPPHPRILSCRLYCIKNIH
jgi:hypothetical protein